MDGMDGVDGTDDLNGVEDVEGKDDGEGLDVGDGGGDGSGDRGSKGGRDRGAGRDGRDDRDGMDGDGMDGDDGMARGPEPGRWAWPGRGTWEAEDARWLREPLERSGLLREAKAVLLPAAVRRGLERVLRYIPAGVAAAAEAAFPRSRVEMLVAAVGVDLRVALAELESAVRGARDEGLAGADLEAMAAASRHLPRWQALREAGGLVWGGPAEASVGPATSPGAAGSTPAAGRSGAAGSPGAPRRRGPSLLREVEAIFLPGKVRSEMHDLLARLEETGEMLDDAVVEMDEAVSVALARAAARDLRSAVATLEAALREARPDRLDPLGQRVVEEVRKQLPDLVTLAAGLAEDLGEEGEELDGKLDGEQHEEPAPDTDES